MAKASLPKDSRIAELFHALSDETRVEIIRRLGTGETCVCDLTDALDAGQSRLSWHLKVLKDAGFVTDRKQGRWIYYALDPKVFEEAGVIVAHFEQLAVKSSASLCCA